MGQARYNITCYTGSTDRQGEPDQISWPDLVEALAPSMDHRQWPHPSEFESLAQWKNAVKTLKNTSPAWSPACYPIGATRGSRNVTHVSMLVWDLDGVDMPALTALADKLVGYDYIMSPSSSDAARQHYSAGRAVRVVVRLAEPVPAGEYPGVWERAAQWLGVKVDQHARDCSRIWYLPVLPDWAMQSSADMYRVGVGEAMDWHRLPGVDGDKARHPYQLPATIPVGEHISALLSYLGHLRSTDHGAEECRELVLRAARERCVDEHGQRYANPDDVDWMQRVEQQVLGAIERFPRKGRRPKRELEEALDRVEEALSAQQIGDRAKCFDVTAIREGAADILRDRALQGRLAALAVGARCKQRVLAMVKAWAKEATQQRRSQADDWTAELSGHIGDNGDWMVDTTIANASLYLAQHEDWVGVIGYDTFRQHLIWRSAPPGGVVVDATRVYPSQIRENDILGVQIWLDRHVETKQPWTTQVSRDAVVRVAETNSIDALRDYLTGLTWDGTARIDRLLVDHYGSEDTAYVRTVTRKTLIAAVARGMEPGCQVDTVLILVGPQGVGKTTLGRVLVPDPKWFVTHIGNLHTKEGSEILPGRWLVELGELASLRKAELGRVKQYISETADTYRPAYARFTAEHPRRCIFIATTNNESILSDHTGARRFWAVRVVKALDRQALLACRDQIWAEAVAAYQAGEPWWLDSTEDAEIIQAHTQIAQEITVGDTRLESVEDIMSSVEACTQRWLFAQLGWSAAELNKAAYWIKDVLNPWMAQHGYDKKRVRMQNGQRLYCYIRDSAAPIQDTLA